MKTLPDRVAVITGAAQGMGLVTAQELARRGAVSILVDINGAKLEGALGSVREIDAREHLRAEWVPWKEAAERVFSWSNRKVILMLPDKIDG